DDRPAPGWRQAAAVRHLVVGRARRARGLVGLAGATAAAQHQPGMGPSAGPGAELRVDRARPTAVGGGRWTWVNTRHGTRDLVRVNQLRTGERAGEALLRRALEEPAVAPVRPQGQPRQEQA